MYGFVVSSPFELTFWKGSSFLLAFLSLVITTNQNSKVGVGGGLAEVVPALRRPQIIAIRIAYILAGTVAAGILGLMAVGIVIAPLSGLLVAIFGPTLGWSIDLSQFEEPFGRAFWLIWGLAAAALCFFSMIKALYGKDFKLF